MRQVNQTIAEQVRRIERGLNAAVDELLTEVENTQILKYTASAFPTSRPSYDRTFRLQSASVTRRTSTKLPTISGVWSADEAKAPAARFVLGKKSQQARIHRGRWKSTEEVEAAVKGKAPGIIQEHLR